MSRPLQGARGCGSACWRRVLRRVVPVLVCVAVAACGGDGGQNASPAARELAQLAGNRPQLVDIDLAPVTRRMALAATSATPVRKVVRDLFELAETNFPVYFPGPQPDLSAGPFAYRYYPASGAYLVVDQEALQIYVLGGPFGDAVTLVGAVIDYLKCVSVSAGFPEAELSAGGGEGDGPGTDGGVGATSADGAIRGADVRLWDGRGVLLGQAVSDDKGLVRLKACAAHVGPYRIEFRGNSRATYFDESIPISESLSGDWRPFTANDVLEAYTPDLSRHITVSTLTHAAAQMLASGGGYSVEPKPIDRLRVLALGERARALVTVDRVHAVNLRVRDLINQQFLGTGLTLGDILTPPELAYSPESLQSFGNNERGRYAQLLTSLSKTARAFNPALPNPAREMTRQLSRDLADGVLDGKDRQGADVAPAATRAYSPQTFANDVVAQAMGRLISQVNGFGAVSMNPVGVPCPDGGIGSCFAWGSTVTLTAQPGGGARFQSWSGACAGVAGPSCVLQMSGDKRVAASFDGSTQQSFALSVGKSGNGSGTLTSAPGGIACGNTCVASFRAAESVTLTATAAAGSSFTGWSGACTGASPLCVVSMTGARSAVANFVTATYTISGTIIGLQGSGLVLSDGISSVSPLPGATSFQFADARFAGNSYSVSVIAQPSGQQCRITNGSGVIQNTSVVNIWVECQAAGLYSVGGTITGLTGNGLKLTLGERTLSPSSGSTAFSFTDALPDGAGYDVFVSAQPAGLTCTLNNGSGVIRSASVTHLDVRCVASGGGGYTVGGTILGLEKAGLVLSLGAQTLNPSVGTTSFTFPSGLANGASYNVQVAQSPIGQYCTVHNGTGVIAGASVTHVEIECMYFVGVNVSGLNAWGLRLQWTNPNYGTPTEWGVIEPSFTGGGYGNYRSGDAYTVTVTSQPTGQTCSIPDPSGVISGADITVEVVCTGTPSVFNVGGWVSSPQGYWVHGLQLTLNGSITQAIDSPGSFYFSSFACDDCLYNVQVTAQPAGMVCTVSNGSGVVSAAPVSNIAVNCALTP